MNILSWVLFGLIAGTVANMLDPVDAPGGILSSVILGILGAMVGGFIANLLFGITVTGFNFTSFVVAILGSLLLLVISRSFRNL